MQNSNGDVFDGNGQKLEFKDAGYKQAVVMGTYLKMPPGKMIAQGAHASMAALLSKSERTQEYVKIPLDENIGPWLGGSFTKVCLKAPDELTLISLFNEAKEQGLPCSIIKDNGRTVFNGVPTITCIAIGPAENEKVDALCRHLKLL